MRKSTRTIKIRLNPNHIQRDMLWGISDACNFLWNYQIHERKENPFITLEDQEKDIPELKLQHPEFNFPYSQTLQKVTQRIQKSYDSFGALVADGDKDAKPPSYRSRNLFFTLDFPQKETSFSIDGRILKLNHGYDRTIYSIRRSSEPIEFILPDRDYSKINTVQICFQDKKWFACMTYEIEEQSLRSDGYTIYFDTGSETELFGITKEGKLYDYTLAPLRKVNKSTLEYIDKLKVQLKTKEKGSYHYRRIQAKIDESWRKINIRTKLNLEKLANVILKDHPNAKAFLYGNWKKKETLADTGNKFVDKKINRAIQNNLPLAKLLGTLKYMAAQKGQLVDSFDEKDTSSTCVLCLKKTHHDPDKRTFECGYCGFRYGRDAQACLNFLRIRESASWQSLLGKDRLPKRSARTSIRPFSFKPHKVHLGLITSH